MDALVARWRGKAKARRSTGRAGAMVGPMVRNFVVPFNGSLRAAGQWTSST
jgi:hypothetical protein